MAVLDAPRPGSTDLWENPMGTDGFEFVEYAGPDVAALGRLFESMGFAKAARHLYDVSRLLADAGVRGSLGGSSEFARTTAADAYRVSVENEFPSTPRPDAGYASSPAFAEGHESQEILRRGLEGIRGLIVGGAPPTLEECRAAILGAAELL